MRYVQCASVKIDAAIDDVKRLLQDHELGLYISDAPCNQEGSVYGCGHQCDTKARVKN